MNKGTKKPNETLGYWYNQLPEDYRQALKQIYTLDFQIFEFDDAIPTT